MQFRIADTFTDSLARLTGEEQKSVKTTSFDLQLDPANPGMQFHKLDRARDKNFWSVRVNRDIRLIVHKTSDSLLLCYVDHHDKAYAWAERRKLQTHPKTGAAQLVEIRETVQEIILPTYVEPKSPRSPTKQKPLFDQISDDDLLGYGVPPEWLADARMATEDSLLALADHLPNEAAEALLELATGGKPRIPEPATDDPFTHPDAQRRFRIMSNVEELARALDFPWDKWTVFLHPDQRSLVEKNYNGPARVAGSAGTGKTIVALHRAVYLARTNPDSRILLATFSEALANALRSRLYRLVSNEPKLAERIEVYSLTSLAIRLQKLTSGEVQIADRETIRNVLRKASEKVPEHKFSLTFLQSEWDHVVDAWQLSSWEAYRDVARLGRKTRLPEAQRQLLWSIFEVVREELSDAELVTESGLFAKLAQVYSKGRSAPFDFAVIDEAQDVGVAQMRFLAALGANRPDALFFAGDLGQRIFQTPFSWKSLGVDIRGRSRTLRVNYRTSHQIRMQADHLLGTTVSDVDGIIEDRSDTISVFNGPSPQVLVFDSESDESSTVTNWLIEQSEAGLRPHEFGVFVRSNEQLVRAEIAVSDAGLPYALLDDGNEGVAGKVSICTMHLAKGLEFRAVVVMACDDEVIPLQERIETVGDDADLQEVYDTERQLMYVACTRARDSLLVTGVDPASEFLDDLKS